MILPSINIFAVILAAFVGMAVGFVWYSNFLFGPLWRRVSGMKPSTKDIKPAAMTQTYTLGSVATLVTAYLLANFLGLLGVLDMISALQAAVWLWIGFVAPVMFTEVLYGKRQIGYYLINVGYQLAAMLAMAVVLYFWS